MPITAAVTIITYKNKQVLLLKRAINPLDPWSGHISLPGGRIEEEDDSLLHAAQRETLEECGIDLREMDPCATLGVELAGLTAKHAIKVQPFHFNLDNKPDIDLQLEEHAEYYWVELDLLRRVNTHLSKAKSTDFPDRLFDCVDIHGTDLWGFTYKVMQDFLKSL